MKRLLAALLCVLFLLTACAGAGADIAADGGLALFAINVGKADCLLLQSGSSIYMIDTGTVNSWGAVSAALHSMQVTHLTGVIVTHTDSDHAGGAWALASSGIAVDQWYASAWAEGKKADKHPVVLAAALRGQTVRWLKAGDTLPLDGGTLRVIGPRSESDIENCNSVVLVAEASGGRMLLAGDMEFPEENELLLAGAVPICDVLKVGNHGESDATSDMLVATVRPKVAVISTNSIEEPDTPAPRVLKALRNIKAETYVTQKARAGVLVTIQNGEVNASLMDYSPWPEAATGVRITNKSVKDQLIQLTNTGTEAIDLSGWYIHSERGNELFVFPNGAILYPGETVTVTSLSTGWQGDYVWHEKKVWHNSKSDAALLYDAYGRLMDAVE